MSTAVQPLFTLDASYARELEPLVLPWKGAAAPAPRLLVLNEDLAAELGVDAAALRTDEGVDVLVGRTPPEGATTVALAYAGHQFGNYSPRLGDGRALLLGELTDTAGHRRDLHLKGSGRTPFSRGGDGFAAVGPMLREYLVGEAMHALGIPTTRALAVVATGADIARETMLPGAVLARVASSHLRVGTFQYAGHQDPELTRRVADYAIARHHPEARDARSPYLALFEAVVEAQASLLAQWMLVGFIHGVMNTDNMTISGETIDYGPCAFMDAFDVNTVFSSIDHGGRYAYGNQPRAAAWNLARFAETLVPLMGEDADAAVEAVSGVLATFPDRYHAHWQQGLATKLGLPDGPGADAGLADALLTLMQEQHVDHTSFFRALSTAVRGDDAPARDLFIDREAFDAWAARWRTQLPDGDPQATADAMDRVNPLYIPRNHRVEEALAAATAGDLAPFERLLGVVTRPFDVRPGLEEYTTPDPSDTYVTYCGT